MKKNKRMIWLIFFATLLGGGAWLLRGVIMQKVQQSTQLVQTSQFTVIAHRGASKDAPENTLEAFRKALAIGADWIELDVHLSKDNKVVVIHDASLERTSTGTGNIGEMLWEDLAELDAGSWKDTAFANEKIPLLEDVLQLVQGKAKLLIEIKVDHENELYQGLTKEILAMIEAHQAQEWCILQAFDSRYLEEIAALAPKQTYHKLIVDDFNPLPAYVDTRWRLGILDRKQGYQALNSYYPLLTPQKIADCHEQGLKVYPYTVDDIAAMQLLVRWGVDGLITNDPAVALILQNRELLGKQ